MRWLWFVASVLCFAIAFRTHSVGLAALCLLIALATLLIGTLALVSSRIESRSRDASTMLGPDEMRRMREKLERERRDGDAGLAVSAGGGSTGTARRAHDDRNSDAGDSGGDGGGD